MLLTAAFANENPFLPFFDLDSVQDRIFLLAGGAGFGFHRNGNYNFKNFLVTIVSPSQIFMKWIPSEKVLQSIRMTSGIVS